LFSDILKIIFDPIFYRESQCSQKGAKDLADKLEASEEAVKATICDGADQVSISSTFYAQLFVQKCFAQLFSSYSLA